MGRQGFVWIAVRKRFLCQMELCWAVLLIQELVGELYEMTGRELRLNKIDSLLGPGMNIHRNPTEWSKF